MPCARSSHVPESEPRRRLMRRLVECDLASARGGVRRSAFGVRRAGFLVPGSWFRVGGSWFLVRGSWFGVLGSGFVVRGSGFVVLGSWFLVLGARFLVLGSELVGSQAAPLSAIGGRRGARALLAERAGHRAAPVAHHVDGGA